MRALIFAPLVAVADPAVAQTADAAPIVASERAFAADFPAMGLPGSFQKWGLPEAIIIGGGKPDTVANLYRGQPVVRQPAEPLLEWWPVFAGVARSGDLGFTTGPAASNGTRFGHYFTVWRRQPDGSWRWVYDGGSSADPKAQPGPDFEPTILPVSTEGSASPAVAMDEVRTAEAALAGAARTDQKAAHLALMAENGLLYVSTQPPAKSVDAFAQALDAWPATFEFGATEGGGASDAGDMVWSYGPAAWVRGEQHRTGYYMRLWQKQPGGWRIVMAQLIPAPIAAPPPAAG